MNITIVSLGSLSLGGGGGGVEEEKRIRTDPKIVFLEILFSSSSSSSSFFVVKEEKEKEADDVFRRLERSQDTQIEKKRKAGKGFAMAQLRSSNMDVVYSP